MYDQFDQYQFVGGKSLIRTADPQIMILFLQPAELIGQTGHAGNPMLDGHLQTIGSA